jgi:hypothetical protein
MNSRPGQHRNMDLAAIFHATASYNPETRTEQEAMLDTAIFLSVAESAIRRATRASTPLECWGCYGIQDLHEHRLHFFKDCPHKTREDVKSNFTATSRYTRILCANGASQVTHPNHSPPGQRRAAT